MQPKLRHYVMNYKKKKKRLTETLVPELWCGLFYHEICAIVCGKVHREVIRRYKTATQCGENVV